MASLGKQARRAIDTVWSDQSGHRYIPRAYSSAGPGWGVWDEHALEMYAQLFEADIRRHENNAARWESLGKPEFATVSRRKADKWRAKRDWFESLSPPQGTLERAHFENVSEALMRDVERAILGPL